MIHKDKFSNLSLLEKKILPSDVMLLKAVKSKVDYWWCRKKTCFSMDYVESYKDVATKLCQHDMSGVYISIYSVTIVTE